MSTRDPVPILSVEERLRVCLTLTKGLYYLSELAGEHIYAGLEDFEPRDVLDHVPKLTRALRDQLLAVRGALTFACLSREAPLRVFSPPQQVTPSDSDPAPAPEAHDSPPAAPVLDSRSTPESRTHAERKRRRRKGGAQ